MEDYGNFIQEEYPKEIIDLARRRCKGLLKYNILCTANLNKIIESAYLQGLVDAAEALPRSVNNEK